jgi:hypothetical protein
MTLCVANKNVRSNENCGCIGKYKRVYLDSETYLPTGEIVMLCGKHVNNYPREVRKSCVTTVLCKRGGEYVKKVSHHRSENMLISRVDEMRQFTAEGEPFVSGSPRYDEMLMEVRRMLIRSDEVRAQQEQALAQMRAQQAQARVQHAQVQARARANAQRLHEQALALLREPAAAVRGLIPNMIQRIPFMPPIPQAPAPPAIPPAPTLTEADRACIAKKARDERVLVPDSTPPPPPPPPPPEPSYLPDPHLPMSEGETRMCAVCMTDVGTVVCSEKRHAMCEECFADYAVIEGNDAGFDGDLRCCGFKPYGCKAQPFRQVFVIRTLPESKASEFALGCQRSKERVVLEEYKHSESERLRREGASSEIERAHTHIVDNILTLRCPNERCGAAIFDFTGCLAIKCNRCKSGVCAKCFELCGRDAHDHLRKGLCKIDPSKHYFADAEYIANVQRLYKTRKLKEYLGTLPERVVKEVLTQHRDEIREGGVNI